MDYQPTCRRANRRRANNRHRKRDGLGWALLQRQTGQSSVNQPVLGVAWGRSACPSTVLNGGALLISP